MTTCIHYDESAAVTCTLGKDNRNTCDQNSWCRFYDPVGYKFPMDTRVCITAGEFKGYHGNIIRRETDIEPTYTIYIPRKSKVVKVYEYYICKPMNRNGANK